MRGYDPTETVPYLGETMTSYVNSLRLRYCNWKKRRGVSITHWYNKDFNLEQQLLLMEQWETIELYKKKKDQEE